MPHPSLPRRALRHNPYQLKIYICLKPQKSSDDKKFFLKDPKMFSFGFLRMKKPEV